MASVSSSSHSNPTSSFQLYNYDVFLSFRGEDVRKTFVDHFFSALIDGNIIAYKDDKELPRGESINPSLFDAIKESRTAVIIFSKNYAESSWCLEELTYIMKCREEIGLIVMPIFYDVNPSEVRTQTGDFGKAFAKQEVENATKAESWRKAFVDSSNIAGWEPKNIANGHESQGIKEIVNAIYDKLFPLNPDVDEDLIGMKARVQHFESRLDIKSCDVRIVGIWGVGGSGKTTLATSVYMKIRHHFQGQCIMENLREESRKYDMKMLQENLLSSVLKRKLTVNSAWEGKHMIKNNLSTKKVLLLLDDVNAVDQLDALVGSRTWFGNGSLIIITTRDEHLLNTQKVDEVYPIRLLSRNESIQLFNKHAFNEKDHIEDYERLSLDVVSYAAGLPLALRVIGLSLCDQEKAEWISAVARLKNIPEMEIMEKLKISYDGLRSVEKSLFLDIACFFRGEETSHAIEILEACDFYPEAGIKVLKQKALISIVGGRFDMHDLIQEMGHYIAKGEHPNNPETHSRVWNVDVIKDMSFGNTTMVKENDNIEAMAFIGTYSHGPDISKRLCKIVSNMKKLRWVKVRMRDTRYSGGPDFISTELRYIDWCGYPGTLSFSSRFYLMKLVVLKLWTSSLKEFGNFQYLPYLKVLQLVDMEELVSTPNFNNIPCLQRLTLSYCYRLEHIHQSLGYHENVEYVRLWKCPRLRMFPDIVNMKKLKTLDLVMCCLGDVRVPNGIEWLHNLQELDLSQNVFSQLYTSLSYLSQLKLLNLSDCEQLVKLPELPSNLNILKVDSCPALTTFGDNLRNCKRLYQVSIIKGAIVDDGGKILRYMLEGKANENCSMILRLEGVEVAKGFRPHLLRGSQCVLQLPVNWWNNFCGFLVCTVVKSSSVSSCQITINNINHVVSVMNSQDDVVWEETDNDGGISTWVGYVSFGLLRHTTWWDQTYQTLLFDMEKDECSAVGVTLIEKKKSTTATSTDDLDYTPEFKIKHDSKSALTVSLSIYDPVYTLTF